MGKPPTQGELFFDQGDHLGFDSYQANLENRQAELGAQLGLPIGKKVAIELRRVAGEHEGVLELANPSVGKGETVPQLKLGTLVFLRSDLARIRVLDRPQAEEDLSLQQRLAKQARRAREI